MLTGFIIVLFIGIVIGQFWATQNRSDNNRPESVDGEADSYSYADLEEAYRKGVQHGVAMQGYRYIETFSGDPGLVNGKGGIEFYICDGFLVNVVTGEEVDPLERVAVSAGRRVMNPQTGEMEYLS